MLLGIKEEVEDIRDLECKTRRLSEKRKLPRQDRRSNHVGKWVIIHKLPVGQHSAATW